MTENLIRIDLTGQECEAIISVFTSFTDSVKRACPSVIAFPDFKRLEHTIRGLQRRSEEHKRETKNDL